MNDNHKMTDLEKELAEALNNLVVLHHDWDKGNAYISVRFTEKNNEAIKIARIALNKVTE